MAVYKDLVAASATPLVLSILAEGESYELAHEVMVEKVWQWVTPEEARFKYARDMLRQDLNNYRNLGLLMPLDRLEIVNHYRDEMGLSEEELELLFRSALAARNGAIHRLAARPAAAMPIKATAEIHHVIP